LASPPLSNSIPVHSVWVFPVPEVGKMITALVSKEKVLEKPAVPQAL
jgi:hypothetical protein